MRTIFYISDRTAITAEALGHSLLVQFTDMKYREITLRYIDSREKAEATAKQINQAASKDGIRPIVFSTLVESDVREIIFKSNAFMLDPFQVFLAPLEAELHTQSLQQTGLSHRFSDLGKYDMRMEALSFSLAHDDGADTVNYNKSDIILIGVSRSGKTPTCLYLALMFGIRAVNYPLTEEVLGTDTLPYALRLHKQKLYGLTTEPERLRQIRSERRPGSRYASPHQCRYELRTAEALFLANNVPFLNTTNHSVEEIATKIVQDRGLSSLSY